MDLAQFDNIARYNKGIHFLLVVVDTLSSFLWVEPVKRKTGALVSQAFQNILKRASPRKPKMIFADKGLEFYNQSFVGLLDSIHVTLYSTSTVYIKAASAERAIRTLKSRLYKLMTYNRSWKYLEYLQEVVNSINKSKNRTIGMSPSQVTKDNYQLVFQKRYGAKHVKKKASFQIGDHVRARDIMGTFKKEFRPSFSKSIYLVKTLKKSNPNMYKVAAVDSLGSEIADVSRAYYSPELVLVTPQFPLKNEFQDPPKKKSGI